MQVVIFGHSHIDALIHASWSAQSIANTQNDIEFKFVRMPITTGAVFLDENGQWHPNLDVWNFLEESETFSKPDSVYISIMGGNEHNLFGLFEHPEPFNVFGTSYQTGYNIPSSLMKKTLETATFYRSELLPFIKSRISGNLFVHETPPPSFDNQYLQDRVASEISESGHNLVIAQPSLRMRLWQLVKELTIENCNHLGIEYLPSPPEALVDGFLAPSFRGNDVTHANIEYGELLLKNLHDRFI